jgi:hypothetical protein
MMSDVLEQVRALVCPGVVVGCRAGERPVVVTTAHRGVFFGYATDTTGDTIFLRRCRNAVYWVSTVKGFVGLATTGPLEGSRVGPAADLTLRNITAVVECSADAASRWEGAPWK